MNSYQNRDDKQLINIIDVNKSFDNSHILKDISMNVNRGEFVSIVGSSGCGKSTLFNIISGLISQDSGSVHVLGDIGYMQQKDLLLPWKNVIDNVVLPLNIRVFDKRESKEKAKEYIKVIGLEGYEEKYPYQLSGGMKQRVSFLRTFLCSEEIMLLDEPFGALDAITKGKMQRWLLEMKSILNRTILFITHDIEEAIFLSDRMYIMSARPGTIKDEISLQGLSSQDLAELKDHIIKIL